MDTKKKAKNNKKKKTKQKKKQKKPPVQKGKTKQNNKITGSAKSYKYVEVCPGNWERFKLFRSH